MTIAASKIIGHGAIFKQGSTTIALIKRIKPPGYDRGKVEVTTLDSTIMDFVPGDPPEITECEVEGQWTGGLASQELLQTAVQAKTNDTYSIVIPWATSRTGTFTAYVVTTTPGDIQSKDPVTFSATLVPTSVITWT